MTPADSAALAWPVFLQGLALSFGLIVAIGAQNSFVLRQGLRKEHVLTVVAICALSDALLIVAGIAGVGAFVEANPALLQATRLGGAAFLIAYAFAAARRALQSAPFRPPSGGAGACHQIC